MVFTDVLRLICRSLKMKAIPISKRIPNLFISRGKHVQYVPLLPRRANSTWLSSHRGKSILYELRCLCIPRRPLFLPTPNSSRYPRSFSNPLVWATVRPLRSSDCPCPCRDPMPEVSLATSLPVIYLQEQHSSGAGLDQMAVISQTEAHRWEAWPILRSAARSDGCRSERINEDAEPRCVVFGSPALQKYIQQGRRADRRI